MYCIKCGVKLADTEKRCPLCATTVYHPDLSQPDVDPLYPQNQVLEPHIHPWGPQLIFTILFLLPISICLVCDWKLSGNINWSGYVVGALAVLYSMMVLPNWFRHPNPAVFVPITFCVIAVYLLYINHAVEGDWFWSFALPVTAYLGLLLTAVVTLSRYIRKKALFIHGGAYLALGGFMLLLEYLLHITFDLPDLGTWSFYPMIVCDLLGISLIIVALVPGLRAALEKKFFL